ncbi:mechanosensitive ion channel family protein [Geobacter sp. AOG2]|uniref:mechanosensitive ion channel family protein n=1 Tax=Geobacter sp. AOG2 TaxID=1566347 RepID=UPI001CC5D340|nr:mechanosensitive ion channel family protein [Geobacter sp. AOG2]GFE60700.1 mechanosensitive ion channel protein [Geobacter sp. AOG2]
MVTADTLNMLLTSACLLVASAVIGLIMEKFVLHRLEALTRRTAWEGDEIIITSLRGLTFYACFLAGSYGVSQFLHLNGRIRDISGKLLLVLFLLLITVFLMRLAAGFVSHYAKKAVLPATSIFINLAKAIAFSMGALIILQSLGISITPILTALGVGGLAVALALQDTLSNIFSGLHIIATRQIRQGDYIRLDGGEEGYVTDITWRNTVVQTLPNNMVLVPNSKLAGAIVTNYHLPDTEMGLLVQVGVSYDSNLEEVERVTIEVAREALQDVQGGIHAFEPFIRYHTFADFSINFTVILRCVEYVDQYLLKHEFIKKLHRRYRDEGIEIPFPIRTVHIKGETSETSETSETRD